MRMSLKAGLAVAGIAVAATAAAQVTFYAGEGFRGQSFTADNTVGNMDRTGFNDRASSAVVNGGNWEVCEHARFEGRCIVLQPGEYPSLAALGMNSNISSVRPVDSAVGQAPPPAYSQRWRPRQ